MKTLKQCENMFGQISPDIQKRIKKFVHNPTFETWDDIHGIIISMNPMKTIWQAVLDIDPTFPRTGRATDKRGNIIKDWGKIPAPLQVLQAIKQATNNSQ